MDDGYIASPSQAPKLDAVSRSLDDAEAESAARKFRIAAVGDSIGLDIRSMRWTSSKIPKNLLSCKVPIQRVEKADLAQTPVLAEPQQASKASRNNDGLEVLETREWLDSLDYVLSQDGPERAGRLLQQLSLHARRAAGVNLPFTATTPYHNTISVRQ